mmetsp:Transcript_19429/g.41843  ORF Transcript_19429/g.41843 Transcript_19429/m.41843 type:complete len:262 (+) Transcript_19429:114-899(+)
MPPSSTSPLRTADHVLWFVPNLIGYSRVALALSSFAVMLLHPDGDDRYWCGLALILYFSSFVGDLVDGWAARKLNQTSQFGGVLDMVTDRCATLGLLQVLTAEYFSKQQQSHGDGSMISKLLPLAFVSLALLDVSSHWCQMYATLACSDGETPAHHKSAEANQGRNFLVQWYYGYYWFFAYLCVGAELTYVLMYLNLHFRTTEPKEAHDIINAVIQWGLVICVPACAAKQVVNLAQLTSSFRAIAQHDADRYNQQETKKGR